MTASLLRIAGALAVAYVLFAVGVHWLVSERLLFQPPPPTYSAGPGVVLLRTRDGGTVAARWLPNPAAKYAILYSHGNAEDLGDLEHFLRALHGEGFSVLAYDYRGYGRSEPVRPTEQRSLRDAEAAYDHLTETLGVAPERIILHGRSLGGGPAGYLAATRPSAGLVLESTFTAVYRAYARTPFLPFDRFRTISRLPDVRVPVLVIHGTADEVVPPWHGEALFRAAREPKRAVWIEGAGHNDLLLVAGDRYWNALRDFAADVERGWTEPP